jgi:hypothetical protein
MQTRQLNILEKSKMSVDPTAEENILPFEDESHCKDNPLPGSNSSLVGDTTEDQDLLLFGDITKNPLLFKEISDCHLNTPVEKSSQAIKKKSRPAYLRQGHTQHFKRRINQNVETTIKNGLRRPRTKTNPARLCYQLDPFF